MSRLDSGKVSEALTQLERELAALWAPEEGSPPKARVCMANLIVLTSAAGRERAVALVDGLAAADTARTFLLTVDPKLPLWGLDASVSARCQRDGERLLCSERIDLSLGAGAVGRVSSILDALSMPEVPTAVVLLEPAQPALITALARGSSRLVIDSDLLGIEGAAGLARATAAHVTDLAWQRLYPWRNQLAYAFDEPRLRPALDAVERVALTASPVDGALPPAGRLLLGWLASRLGWQLAPGQATDSRRQAVALDLQASPEPPPGLLRTISLSARLGQDEMSVSLTRDGATLRAERSLAGRVSHEKAPLPDAALSALVDRALDDTLPDAPLRQALQAASAFAPPLAPHKP